MDLKKGAQANELNGIQDLKWDNYGQTRIATIRG